MTQSKWLAVFFVLTCQLLTAGELPAIRLSQDGQQLVDTNGQTFRVWGVNYDHDDAGRLIEDYWSSDWSRVVEDLQEIKASAPTWCEFICKSRGL